MSITINDVARLAGVSMKTVSRVINREPSVKKGTFEKVMAAVDELNYQPNLAARNLASTKSYVIGFIYNNPNAYYVIDMQNGILSECRKQGYELLIHPSEKDIESFNDELKAMVKHSRLAGLVLTPPFSELPDIVDTLNDLEVAFVRIVSGSEQSKDQENCVLIDDRAASFDITEHLIQYGHSKIGFLCGGPEHKSSEERLQGYLGALDANGIQSSKQLIVDGDYSFESGVNGAKRLLGKKQRPTAIFASNDEIAAGALFAARLMNIKIPEELSIVGFEDSPFSRQTWPKLTTAHQPNKTIASQAAALLINQLRQQNEPDEKAVNSYRFCPELIVRDSTGPVLCEAD